MCLINGSNMKRTQKFVCYKLVVEPEGGCTGPSSVGHEMQVQRGPYNNLTDIS